MNRSHVARLVCGAALGATIFSSIPAVPVYADTTEQLQVKLDQANAHLDELYAQATEVGEQVNQAQTELEETVAEIDQKQSELDSAQTTLAGRVSANYKTGGISLLSIFFGSSSFEDLANRLYLATKASDSDAEVINEVKSIQAELDAKRSQQEKLLGEVQTKQDELSSKVAEAESYVSSLDQQVQEKMAEEQAAREAAQSQAQADAQQNAANNGGYVNPDNVVKPEIVPNNGGSKPSNNGGSSNTSGGFTAAQRNAIVSAAWAKVGCSYVYGATGPNSYDCSGFVQYCYRAAGISLSHSSYSQGAWGRTTSNPQPGDIVCWGGHVGIYMGGGMMIDAGTPRTGVSYRAVYGSPWYQTL